MPQQPVFVGMPATVRRQPGDPTPMSAADILRRAMDAGFDPVKLAGLRTDRAGELADHRARSIAVGDRAGADGYNRQYADLQGEMAADPYTGNREADRVDGIQESLDKFSMARSPESQDFMGLLSQQGAQRAAEQENAVGTVKAKLLMDPNAQAAADAASRRKIAEQDALYGGKTKLARDNAANRPLAMTTMENIAGLNAAEIEGVKVLKQLRSLGLDQSNDPLDPRWNKFVVGTLKMQPDEANAFAKADIQQRTAMVNAALTRGLMGGRPSQYIAELIQQHLPDGAMSGEQLSHVLDNVLQQTNERRQEVANLTHKDWRELSPVSGETYPAYLGSLNGGAQRPGQRPGDVRVRRME